MIYLAWQVYSVAHCVAVKLFDRGPAEDEPVGTDPPATPSPPHGTQENHADGHCTNTRAPDDDNRRSSPAVDNLLELQEVARETSEVIAVADGGTSPAPENIQGASPAPENTFRTSTAENTRRISPAPQNTRRKLPAPDNNLGRRPAPGNNQRTLPTPGNNRRTLPTPGNNQRTLPAPGNNQRILTAPGNNQHTLPTPENNRRTLPAPKNNRRTLPAPDNNRRALPDPKNFRRTFPESDNSRRTLPDPKNHRHTNPAPENNRHTLPESDNNQRTLPTPENNRRTLPAPDNTQRTLPAPDNNRRTLPESDNNRGTSPVLEKTESTDMSASPPVSTDTLPSRPALSEHGQCLRSSIASTQSLLNAYLEAFDGYSWSDSPPADLQVKCNINDDSSRATAEGNTPEVPSCSDGGLQSRGSQQVAETDLKECIYMMQRLTSTHQAVQQQVDTADRSREKRRLLRIERKLKKSVQLMQRLVEAHLALLRSAPNRSGWERELYARARRWSIKVMQQLIRSHIVTLNESRARLLSAPRSHRSTKSGGCNALSRERQHQFTVAQLTESTPEVKPATLDEIARTSHEPFTIERRDAEPCPPVTLEWWWDPTATSHESHSNSSRCSQTDQSVTSNDSLPSWPDPELQQCTTSDPSVPVQEHMAIKKNASTCSTDCRQRERLVHVDQDTARCCRSLSQVLEARLQVLFTPQLNLQNATSVPQSARAVCGGDMSIAVKTFDSFESVSEGEVMGSGSVLDDKGALSQRKPVLQQVWDTVPVRQVDSCLHIAELSDTASRTHQTSVSLQTEENNTDIRLLSSDQSIQKRTMRYGRRFKTKRSARQTRMTREHTDMHDHRQRKHLVASSCVEYETESRWLAPNSAVPPVPTLPLPDLAPSEQFQHIAMATPDWNDDEQFQHVAIAMPYWNPHEQLQHVTMATPDWNTHEQLQHVTMATPYWNSHQQLQHVTMATPDCNSHEHLQHVTIPKQDWNPHEQIPTDRIVTRPGEVACAACRQTSALVTTHEKHEAPHLTSDAQPPTKTLTRDTITDERPIFISLSH